VSLAAAARFAAASVADDAPDAAGAFGVALTPLSEGLRRTAIAAAAVDRVRRDA
jgi:hypothetical protein